MNTLYVYSAVITKNSLISPVLSVDLCTLYIVHCTNVLFKMYTSTCYCSISSRTKGWPYLNLINAFDDYYSRNDKLLTSPLTL